MGRLQDKVAIITGAGRKKGLGEGIARRFAEEGATVIITDIGKASGDHLPANHIGTSEEMEEVAAALRSETGGKVHTLVCDVRSEDDIIRTIADTVQQFGKLDIVVNNAGIGYIMKPLTEMSIDEWDIVLDVNLRGPFLFTKHAAKQFIKQGEGGRIINIASQAAKSPAPLLVHYTSSKHGMIGLTRTAAAELGTHGITCNAVCPNHVTTGLGAIQNARRGEVLGKDTDGVLEFRKAKIPLGRVGLTSDTANACVFLASEEAAYITGEAMNVSGGEEMH
jgi:NAD(P)-dependent dehydrogenase (short-subunit alcohol dehydrogenase family)